MYAIEVKNLSKSYGGFEAVKKISFNIEKGSFIAFLGENGAGKSTTINILCTVLEKTSGEVFICGHNLDLEKSLIKQKIGIVFQGSVLDNELTVLQNLKCRASLYNIDKQRLNSKLDYLKEKLSLNDILNKKYKNLSGGQRRRVDIARALINDPEILFLDEPTTGLDPKTRLDVWNVIDDLRKSGLTVFLTTHYMEETRLCDNVIILDNGIIKATGTPNELKNKYATDRLIWYTERSQINDLILKDYSYKYNKSAYVVKINNSSDVIDLIYNNKSYFKDFEIIKGDMDDVFLNITGKELK